MLTPFYVENNDKYLYGIIKKFYLNHIEKKVSTEVKNGNFIVTKEIIFK